MADEQRDQPTATTQPMSLPSPEPPIVRQQVLGSGDTALAYTSTTGMMPLANAKGEVEAHIFYTAYTVDSAGDVAQRPVLFVFNGGPGSASIWLHMGAFGPKRILLGADGSIPPLPYRLVENEHTLLASADLVFVDPIGTGFSRAANDEISKKAWSVAGDLESVGEFVRLYLTRNERMTAPVFLMGESYGTFRAAGLASALLDKHIAVSGIVLIAPILSFQTAVCVKGNDLAFALVLPTYSAAAHYQQRLAPELQAMPLPVLLAEVEQWAEGWFTLVLIKGDRMPDTARAAAVRQLARYTGLSETYVANSDLRVPFERFIKELLRDTRRSVSAYDARLQTIDGLGVGDYPDFDFILNVLGAPFTMLFNDYVRRELGFRTDSAYETLNLSINAAWDWGKSIAGWPDTSEALRRTMSRNTAMRVFVAAGIYDSVTPYFASEYVVNHLGLDPVVRGNISTRRYESGHMIYIEQAAREQLHADIAAFLR